MAASKNNNNGEDLSKGEINLLPEDMRKAEKKARDASQGREVHYQLREPKKIRRREGRFAWIPFVGRMHWAVTPEEKAALEEEKKKISDVVVIDEKTGERKPRMSGQGQQPIKAFPGVASSPFPPSVSPRVRKFRRNPFAFLFRSGRKSAQFPRPSGSLGTTLEQPAHSTFQAPPRHYSLLKEKETPGSPSRKPGEQLGSNVPFEPLVATEMQTMPQQKPILSSEPTRQRGGISLPRWLDIFALLSFFTRRKKVKKTPGQLPQTAATPTPQQVQNIFQPNPVTSHVSWEKTRPDLQPVADAGMPKAAEVSRGSLQAVTPDARGSIKKNYPKGWALPKWLDIFYWLSLISWRSRKPKLPKAKVVPVSPAPSQPMPEAPRPGLRPVTPSLQVQPQPREVMENLRPPLQPIHDITPPGVAPVSQSGMTPVTPTAQPRIVSTETPMPAPAPAPKGSPDKHDKNGWSKIKESVFHIPQKKGFQLDIEGSKVNLIPATYSLRDWGKISQIMIITGVATLVFVGILFGALGIWEDQIKNRTSTIFEEIKKFQDDIERNTRFEKEMASLGSRIDLIEQLLKKHIYWTNFFVLLEKYTLPDMYYEDLTATVNGNLTLKAHASSYTTITQLLELLKSDEAKEFVSNASVTSAVLSESERGKNVSFSIDLKLNPNLFYYHNETVPQE